MTDPLYAAHDVSTLRKQIMLLVRRLRRETTSVEMPLGQMFLLSRIDQLGDEASPTALAEQEGLRPQNLSALLRKLEQQGLTYREDDAQDKRKYRIRLTDVGLEALEQNRSNRDSWLAQTMSATLNPDDVAILRQAGALLERMAMHVDPSTKNDSFNHGQP
jgi:DNA-binding MarR family transcriptional regulator